MPHDGAERIDEQQVREDRIGGAEIRRRWQEWIRRRACGLLGAPNSV